MGGYLHTSAPTPPHRFKCGHSGIVSVGAYIDIRPGRSQTMGAMIHPSLRVE